MGVWTTLQSPISFRFWAFICEGRRDLFPLTQDLDHSEYQEFHNVTPEDFADFVEDRLYPQYR